MTIFSRFRRVAPNGSFDDDRQDPEFEIFHNLQRQKYLLAPDGSPYSKRRHRWRLFLLLLVLYDALALPLQTSFHLPSNDDGEFELPLAQLLIGYLIDLCFILDIVIMFRTCYVSKIEEGAELVTEPKLIASRYYRKGFALDLLAVLPIEVCAAGFGMRSLTATLLRYNRLLRVSRVVTVHTAVFKMARVKRLACFFVFFLVVAHWVACAWWAIGNSEENMSNERGFPPWLYRIPNRGVALTGVPVAAQYVSCFYWAVTTLMKVPWVHPSPTVVETIFTIVLLLIGAVAFALLIGEVTQIIAVQNDSWRKRSEMMDMMRTFCTTRGVPDALQTMIYSWVVADQEFQNKYTGKASALQMLPPGLRGELVRLIHADVLKESPFTKHLSSDAVGALALHLTPQVCLKKHILVEEGYPTSTLYIMQRGSLRLAAPLPKPGAEGGGKGGSGRSCSKRVSCAVKSNNDSSRKATKTFARFRMLERAGALVGLAQVDGSVKFPFQVEATRITHLFALHKKHIRAAQAAMSSDEAEKVSSIIVKEHTMHVDSLKFTLNEEATARESQKKSDAVTQALKSTEVLSERSSWCLSQLEDMSSSTACLSELLDMVQETPAKDEEGPAAAPGTAPAGGGRYGRDKPPSRQGNNMSSGHWRRNDDGNSYEQLEETTQVAAVTATVM